MSTFPTLAAALAVAPYDKMTGEEAADALNALTVATPRAIPAREIKRLWSQHMVLAAAKIASEDITVSKPARVLCLTVYDSLMGDLFADLDPADPKQAAQIKAFLDGLQAAGVLSEAVRAETLALATEQRPMRERWGFAGPISYTDVEAARAA